MDGEELNVPAKELPVEPKHRKDWRESFHWRIFRIMAEFVDGFQFIADFKKTVTFFGSARFEEKDKWYEVARELAKMLVKADFAVVTGGGPGIMEAAAFGHKEGQKKANIKSHVIGLGIKLPHEQRFNKAVSVRARFERFSSRLDNFMLLSNIVIVAPGGVGTLLELFYTWQLMQVKHICHVPIILLGDMWKGLLYWLKKDPLKKGFFENRDYDLLFHAKSADEAIKVIDKAYEEYMKGNKDFCINYKEYKI